MNRFLGTIIFGIVGFIAVPLANASPVPLTAESVAARADTVMASLKNTRCDIAIQGRYGEWQNLAIQEQIKIKDLHTYWVQYAIYTKGRHFSAYQVSNGHTKMRNDPTIGVRKLGSSLTQGQLPSLSQLPELWWRTNPQLFLDAWIENRPTFSKVITAFRQAHFDVKCTQTRTKQLGHQFVDDVVTITRPAYQLATRGPARTVIVFDDGRGLPVSVVVEGETPKKDATILQLRAFWAFRQHFSDLTFSQLKPTADTGG